MHSHCWHLLHHLLTKNGSAGIVCTVFKEKSTIVLSADTSHDNDAGLTMEDSVMRI